MRVTVIIVAIMSFYLAMLPFSTKAQTECVKIKFEIDGKEIVGEKFKVLIDADGQIIEPKLLKNGFIVPPEVNNWQKIELRVVFREYDLRFSQLTKYHFDGEWIIGVNNPPFKEQSDLPLWKDGKELRLIYYIEFHPNNAEGTGRIAGVYK
jgi:hypothetical protein